MAVCHDPGFIAHCRQISLDSLPIFTDRNQRNYYTFTSPNTKNITMRKCYNWKILPLLSLAMIFLASGCADKKAASSGPETESATVNPLKWIIDQQSALTPWEVSHKIIRELKP